MARVRQVHTFSLLPKSVTSPVAMDIADSDRRFTRVSCCLGDGCWDWRCGHGAFIIKVCRHSSLYCERFRNGKRISRYWDGKINGNRCERRSRKYRSDGTLRHHSILHHSIASCFIFVKKCSGIIFINRGCPRLPMRIWIAFF